MRLGLLREQGVLEASVKWAEGTVRVVHDPVLTDLPRLAASAIFREPQAAGRHRYRAEAPGQSEHTDQRPPVTDAAKRTAIDKRMTGESDR